MESKRRRDFPGDGWGKAGGGEKEADGLRYHRTPAEQARDRLRDQAHTAAGLTPLRFTHYQIRYEAEYVSGVLAKVAGRLRR